VAIRRAAKQSFFERVDHFRVVEGISVRGATEKDVLEDPESGARYIAKLGGRNNDLEVSLVRRALNGNPTKPKAYTRSRKL